jgi:release factor glutamine methyltransferase
MNALDKLKEAKEFLENFGIDNAWREAELIISHCTGKDRIILYRDNPEITEDIISKIDECLKRRSKREPLQYILGYTEFRGLMIKVGRGVLIPRPETELLLEEAVKIISNFEFRISNFKILDLCTGSGCVALSIAREFPDAQIYGTDTSEIAIGYARQNSELNRINNVIFMKGSLFEPIKDNPEFNLIVSNPPYIRRNDIKNLQPEIKNWEPLKAIDGGEDGLDYYREIISESKGFLKKGGSLILELGIDQSEAVKKMALDAGFIEITLIKDFNEIERILVARFGIV